MLHVTDTASVLAGYPVLDLQVCHCQIWQWHNVKQTNVHAQVDVMGANRPSGWQKQHLESGTG